MARRTPSRLRSCRIHVSAGDMAVLAQAYCARHGEHLSDGYRLTLSSTAWLRSDGQLTVRFVYRRRRGERGATITYTLRGLTA